MSHPAKPVMVAPRARWTESRAVRRRTSDSADMDGDPRARWKKGMRRQGLPLCRRNLRASPSPVGTRGKRTTEVWLAPWVGHVVVTCHDMAAFQNRLPRAVTVPERFRGGLAPSAPVFPALPHGIDRPG